MSNSAVIILMVVVAIVAAGLGWLVASLRHQRRLTTRGAWGWSGDIMISIIVRPRSWIILDNVPFMSN
jgi:Flp pilus assembly protein CpaB